MKKIILMASLLATTFAACQNQQEETAQEQPQEQILQAAVYGDSISEQNAQPVSQVPQLLQGQDSTFVKLDGTALTSCTKKGCWMTVALDKEEEMRVTFKDYAFFVPKDLNGQKVVMEGMLKRVVSSVDEQRHFAEDAGKTAVEVAAIQQPDTIYTFEAAGVLIWPQAK